MKRLLILALLAGTAHADPDPEPLYSKETGVGDRRRHVGRGLGLRVLRVVSQRDAHDPSDLHARGFRREHVRRRRRQARPLLGRPHVLVRHDRGARPRRLRTLPSSWIAFGLSQVFGTVSEYKDSLHYQFEYGDIIANCSGALFTVLLENGPALDRLIDFRVEYWPTPRVPAPAPAGQRRRRAGLQRPVVHARASTCARCPASIRRGSAGRGSSMSSSASRPATTHRCPTTRTRSGARCCTAASRSTCRPCSRRCSPTRPAAGSATACSNSSACRSRR